MLIPQNRHESFPCRSVLLAIPSLQAYAWSDCISPLFCGLLSPFCSRHPGPLAFLPHPQLPHMLFEESLYDTIPSLNLFLSDWQVCWQRYFCSTLSGGSCLFQAAVDLQRGSQGHRHWNPTANATWAINCLFVGFIQSSSGPCPSPAGLRRALPGSMCPWSLSPEPCSHFPGHPQQYLCRRASASNSWMSLSSLYTSNWSWSSSKQQAFLYNKSGWGPSSPAAESASTIAHHFLLVVLSGSDSTARKDPFGSTPSSSSITRSVNVFCSCKSLGDARPSS